MGNTRSLLLEPLEVQPLSERSFMGKGLWVLLAKEGEGQMLCHFGQSFAALKMELRLLRAAWLLGDSSLRIIEVAEQCSFNHPS